MAGVRRSVWIASAALVAAAVLLAIGLRSARSPRADGAAAAAAIAAPASASPPPSDTSSVAAAVAAPPPADARIGAASAPTSAAPATAPAAAIADAQRARVDSRLDADLRVLEEDAARLAESRGLLDPAVVDAAQRVVSPVANATTDDARRTVLADAALVEHFVQDAYQGTEFPIGYPAEERTRAAAVSYVQGLSPEMRKDMLETVLAVQADAPAPIGPRFAPPESGFVWEGALQ